MALAIKALGGIGKAAVGAGGAVIKGGARIFGDDAVEALGRGVGKAQSGIDDVVKHAVKQDEIYKAAKNEARGIKEASKKSGDVVDDAIQAHTKRQVAGTKKNSAVTYSNKDGKYYRQVNGQKPVELSADQYKMHLNGQDAELATQLAESADAWSFGDIANWASENQGKALAIAGGVGVAGGALLFGGDDE